MKVGRPLQAKPVHPKDDTKRTYKPKATAWPKASNGTVKPAAPTAGQAEGAKAQVSGSPVWVQTPKPADGATAPGSVAVSVLDHAKSTKLGVSGVVFSIDAGAAGGKLRVGLDYSSFAEAYGGNYGSRLQLVSLPACALTTPEVPACRVQTPLTTDRDPRSSTVSAQVEVGTAAAATPSKIGTTVPASTDTGSHVVSAVWSGDTATAVQASTASTPQVLAATVSSGQEGSAGGSYSAGALSPSGSWTGGSSGGSFTYSYPVTVPGATTSLTPSVSLGYDSGEVDGKTASTQAQASWLGDGWSTPDSFIEQTFIPCSDSPEGSPSPSATNDECYAGQILTLSLNGSSTSLVYDASKGTYTSSGDDGAKIAHITGANNGTGTYNTDYWTVTDRSGTVYSFGRNQLPGWSAGKPATNSVDSMPVYSAHPGDPCYNASGFNASVCTTAYKWHLDYVKNIQGQAMAYYYAQDTNYYGQNNGATNTQYVRDSHLARIDYGFLDGGAYNTVPDQVSFTTAPRCVATTCDPISAGNSATQYPDVPFDLICASGATCSSHSPSFFSTVRLKQIATTQYDTASAGYKPVDSYGLAQTEPPTGDGTSPTLWLSSITRTGSDTSGGGSGTITLPAVTFGGTTMQNRVDTTNFPGMFRYRLTSITGELGAVTGITYGLPNPCTPAYIATANPASNTGSCYPVSWTPPFYSAPVTDWFQKYAVTQVLETDITGAATDRTTTYDYAGGAAWHYDDNEIVQPKYRTWGQFRGYATVTSRSGNGTSEHKTKSVTDYYRGMDGDYLTPTTTRSITLTDSQGGTHADSPQLSGSALETSAYLGDGGVVDHSSITSYWISPATATRTRTGLAALTANTVKPAETFTRQAVTTGGSTTWRYTETDSTYNANTGDAGFGLLTATYTHTVPVNAVYDACATVTYAPANTTLNLIGLAASQESDSVACAGYTQGAKPSAPAGYNTLTAPASVNRPAQVVSATRTFYDDPSFSTAFPQAAAPTVGNVTMVRQAADYTAGAFTWQTAKRATYDTYGRPLVTYDGNGNATTTAYTTNAVGLTTGRSVTNAKNQTASSTIAPVRGLPLTATDANGVVSTTRYDTLGRLTSVWLNSRPTTAAANQVFGYTVSQTSVSGTTTQKLNDGLGYITSYTLYDSLGRVRQTQDPTPMGGRLLSESSYDSRGWVRKKNNAFWDKDNNPVLALAPSPQDATVPNQDVYTYDGLGRTVVDTSFKYSAVQEVTTTVYNGDRTTVVPPAGGTVKTTVVDPLGRTVELDDFTARPTVAPPVDPFTGTYTVSGGTSQAITYGFDGHGKQNTTTAAGSTWTTTYNLLGQATGKTDPDAGASTMTYDGAGNLKESTDSRAKTVSYTYDTLNRKTATYAAPAAGQSSANQLAAWVYDNDNAVANVTYPIGHATTTTAYNGGAAYITQSLGFNVFGESLGDTYTIPSSTEGALLGKNYTFKHSYTPHTGLLDNDTLPLGSGLPSEIVGHAYSTAFDLPAGLGTTSYSYVQDVTYDAYGHVGQTTLGGDTNLGWITNTYDDHTGRLTDQRVSRSNTGTPSDVDLQHYDYDLAGNTTRQTSTRLGATTETQCYRYDQLDRLTTAWTATDSCTATPTPAAHSTVGDAITGGAYWTDWAFDQLGNRTTHTDHSTTGGTDTTVTYTYNGNGAAQPHTLTSTSASTSYRYDATGNTTTRTTPTGGTQNLTWDNAGHLTAITGGTAGNTSYVYDADGQVLLQKDPGTTTLYLPGQQVTLNTTTNTLSSVRYYALPGGGTVVRTGTGTNYRFEIADPHGTNGLNLDNTAQTPTWRQFTPYGAPRGTPATWPDNRGFLNAPTSTATSLTTVGARQYDPILGRFISVDPVLETTDAQQLGGYTYAGDNPIGGSDPTGLLRQPDFYGGGEAGGATCEQECQDDAAGNPEFSDIPEDKHGPCTLSGGACGGPGSSISMSDVGKFWWDVATQPVRDGWNCGWNHQDEACMWTAVTMFTAGEGALLKATLGDLAATEGGAAEVGNIRLLEGGEGVTILGGKYKTPNVPTLKAMINPGGGETNCRACAVALDYLLAGKPASAVPWLQGGDKKLIEQIMGRRFHVRSLSNIVSDINKSGDGARGIVIGYIPPTAKTPGIYHAFNVLNKKGDVLFLDGQTGHANYVSRMTNFQFMATNP
ncbi:RHS repeat-associated core domain-containing protein [Kitasatospora paracochleata]|uniref:RHS repeat-associated protein n=1 Tax=Kitasatospora paracochleata TaxID=58354 RepID=A0ABT1JA11_9ACTN|nr:RHS repeat-associated core domain-containing protein [Kitasatospora paracochleata]MCP2314287.1 RHS repeat-associated protein [Kitasatospora paracochleata]